MTRAEIKSDPWKARAMAVENLNTVIEKVESVYISEDGMAEDPKYRKEIVDMLSGFLNLTEKLSKNL